MDEDEFVTALASPTEELPEGLYDRAIAALSVVDAKDLIMLEAECEQLSRASFCPVLTRRAQFTIAEKHRILAKLLVETRDNLRILSPREAGDGVHAARSWIDGRTGAAWLR